MPFDGRSAQILPFNSSSFAEYETVADSTFCWLKRYLVVITPNQHTASAFLTEHTEVPDVVAEASESRSDSSSSKLMTGVGSWFLQDMWYMALPGSELKRGQMKAKTMLG